MKQEFIWYVSDSESGEWWHVVKQSITDEDDFEILYSGDDKPMCDLIAAAPDLLDACEFVLSLIQLAERFDVELGKGWQDAKKRLQPSIAKAKPQNP